MCVLSRNIENAINQWNILNEDILQQTEEIEKAINPTALVQYCTLANLQKIVDTGVL